MRLLLLTLTALILAGAPAQGSLIENATTPTCASVGVDPHECTYQADGGHHGDAGDTCPQASPGLHLNKAAIRGVMVTREDSADNYQLQVTEADMGKLLQVWVRPTKGPLPPATSGYPTFPYSLQVWSSDCRTLAKGEPMLIEDGSVLLSFAPTAPGLHVVEVQIHDPRPLSSAGPLSVDPLGAAPATCHPMCLGDGMSQTTGYTLGAWG